MLWMHWSKGFRKWFPTYHQSLSVHNDFTASSFHCFWLIAPCYFIHRFDFDRFSCTAELRLHSPIHIPWYPSCQNLPRIVVFERDNPVVGYRGIVAFDCDNPRVWKNANGPLPCEIISDFDDICVVAKLTTSAFQRRKFHRNAIWSRRV